MTESPPAAGLVKRLYQLLVPSGLRNRLWQMRHSGLPLYLRKLGLRGLPAYRALKRDSGVYRVRPPGSHHALEVRLGTSDVHTFEKIFLLEEYAPPPGLRPRLIIDGGAYVGYSAVYFALRFPEARIHAIEPEAGNYGQLRRNAEPYPNIRPQQAALWSRHEPLALKDPGRKDFSFQVEPSATSAQTVEAKTIDEILDAAAAERIDLLKLDVEGTERELFAGQPKWLAKTGCLMIELHERHFPGCEAVVHSALAEESFVAQRRGETTVFVR